LSLQISAWNPIVSYWHISTITFLAPSLVDGGFSLQYFYGGSYILRIWLM
jgi:hypothetical protein